MKNITMTNIVPPDDNIKVAYALNLCAVSISQIIDSNDIVVLKQEREAILNNLNLQNFVKHPALLDVLKRILDTITYLEIQAGDLSFVEKNYQKKLKNAIWNAIPSPGVLFAGGNPVSVAIAVAASIGTGYMNYRRSKNEYADERMRQEWELKRHEIEQLEGLKAMLFETSWRLASDYDFDDKYRLTQKQLSRYSAALLEPNSLTRYERLSVMKDKFAAFPPFWYHLGNAAMEVFRDEKCAALGIADNFRQTAIDAYQQFNVCHFEFLREDVTAASCCLELISLLEPGDPIIGELLDNTLRFAGENYDVLQQAVLVLLQRKEFDRMITPLREMVVSDYNVGLNANILSSIYINAQDNIQKIEHTKLFAIAPESSLPWADDVDTAEQLFCSRKIGKLTDVFTKFTQRVKLNLAGRKATEKNKGAALVAVGRLDTCFKKNDEISKILSEIQVAIRLDKPDNLVDLSRKFGNALTEAESQIKPAVLSDVIDVLSNTCKAEEDPRR